MIAFLIWMFIRRRDNFSQVRNTAGARDRRHAHDPAHSRFAPPRLTPGLGFVDTGALYHQSVYATVGTPGPDQLSAMPSVHVAWSLLVALGVVVFSTSRWRWWIIAPPVHHDSCGRRDREPLVVRRHRRRVAHRSGNRGRTLGQHATVYFRQPLRFAASRWWPRCRRRRDTSRAPGRDVSAERFGPRPPAVEEYLNETGIELVRGARRRAVRPPRLRASAGTGRTAVTRWRGRNRPGSPRWAVTARLFLDTRRARRHEAGNEQVRIRRRVGDTNSIPPRRPDRRRANSAARFIRAQTAAPGASGPACRRRYELMCSRQRAQSPTACASWPATNGCPSSSACRRRGARAVTPAGRGAPNRARRGAAAP